MLLLSIYLCILCTSTACVYCWTAAAAAGCFCCCKYASYKSMYTYVDPVVAAIERPDLDQVLSRLLDNTS